MKLPSSCVLTSVVQEPSGRVLVNFASGQQLEFNNMAQLTEAIDAVDSNETQTDLMCIGYAKARSDDLSQVGSVKDKTFSFTLGNPQPIRIQ